MQLRGNLQDTSVESFSVTALTARAPIRQGSPRTVSESERRVCNHRPNRDRQDGGADTGRSTQGTAGLRRQPSLVVTREVVTRTLAPLNVCLVPFTGRVGIPQRKTPSGIITDARAKTFRSRLVTGRGRSPRWSHFSPPTRVKSSCHCYSPPRAT